MSIIQEIEEKISPEAANEWARLRPTCPAGFVLRVDEPYGGYSGGVMISPSKGFEWCRWFAVWNGRWTFRRGRFDVPDETLEEFLARADGTPAVETTVTDDPDSELPPAHCITPAALRSLAVALEQLEAQHSSVVGGERFVLELRPEGWWLR